MHKQLLAGTALFAVSAMCVCLTVSEAKSQTRESAFQDVLADPTDPVAMLTYARLAVADRDYEAVVSTLERLLDVEPGHVEARYELAIAYYALGSYELAEFHFRLVQEMEPGGPRAQDSNRYLAQIEERTRPNDISGSVSVGAVIGDDGAAGSLSAALRWDADLGGAFESTWTTDLQLGFYSGDAGLATSRVSIRTGPTFSLDGMAYGAKLQPYLEALYVADDDDDLNYSAVNLGARYLNTHGDAWSSFADLKFGQLDGDINGDTWAATLGASYTPSRETRLRFLVSMADRDTDLASESRERQTARLEVRHSFAPLLGDSGRNWLGTAFAQYDVLDYDSGREDTLTTFGVSVRAFVSDDVFIETGLRSIDRNSSDSSLNDSTPLFSFAVGRVF